MNLAPSLLALICFSAYTLSACRERATEPCLAYKNPVFKALIANYIDNLRAQKYRMDVITVSILPTVGTDSSTIRLNPNYPYLKKLAYLGQDTMQGTQVFFTGTHDNRFVTLPCQRELPPPEVLAFNEAIKQQDRTHAYLNSALHAPEFMGWEIHFIGDTISRSNFHR